MTYEPDMVVMDYVGLIRELKAEEEEEFEKRYQRELEFINNEKIYGYFDILRHSESTEKRKPMSEDSSYQSLILWGLQRKPTIYGGTVPHAVIQNRRAKNKLARKADRARRAKV